MTKVKGTGIKPEDFSRYMNALLEEFGTEVASVTETVSYDVAQQAKNKLRQKTTGNFNNISGSYRKGWRAELRKYNYGVTATVFNKTDYRLTHLLEFGHEVKNKYGSTKSPDKKKRATAYSHIADVNDWAIEQFELGLALQLEKLGSK